jgi:pimeloyl-ACP methyl ester carboxylesterase
MWGCSEDEKTTVVGPQGYEEGGGNVFSVEEFSFPSADLLQVGVIYGRPQEVDVDQRFPVVILVHAFARDYLRDWFQATTFFEDLLLEQGYLVLAINLRGHGNTSLPDDREILTIEDIENSYLDVQAALIWLGEQPEVDASRVAVVGAGFGANVAYVSIGRFPQQIRAAVALSPGFWNPNNDNQSIGIGAGLEPFAPHSMLFVAGENDFAVSAGDTLSSAKVASELHQTTSEPKELKILEGKATFGTGFLCDPEDPQCDPEIRNLLLDWLRDHL